MSLRLATTEDVDVVLRFALDFYKASPYKLMRFDRRKATEFLCSVIHSGHTIGLALIALEDSKPVGILIGVQAEPVFSGVEMATELAWWVDPECRDRSAGRLMLDAYEDWALRVGCSYVQVASLVDLSPVELEEFYKSRHYVQAENSFMKVIKIA